MARHVDPRRESPDQPDVGAPASASPVVQVAFFAAVLAFQAAAVAGFCAASRAAARWPNHGVRADDRIFVHCCSTVSAAGLGVAAVGWATAVGLSLGMLAHPDTATLAAGAAMMIGGALGAGVFVARLRVNAADEAGDDDTVSSGVVVLGERSIGVVRRYPLLSCAVVALLCAAASMAHAETTVYGALPWGLAQAVAVVAGFVLLGPALGFRRHATSTR